MLCEQVLGKLHDFDTTGKTVEYVDIEWHEAFKKIHKKTTDKGTEVGIRMDDSILARGLYQDDVIYADNEKLVVVNTPPCEVIRVSLTPGHEKMSAKVCYEIGNRHAPLFWGENDTFITIYNEPMLVMLQKIHGVQAEKESILNEARGKASNEYDRIVADAQTEAKKIMDNASKNATLEEQKRIEQAQEQIAGLVVEATAKLVAAKQNADSDRELYNQFIAKTGEKID